MTRNALLCLLLNYSAFALNGVRSGALNIAWPGMQADFNQPAGAIGLLLSPFIVSYLLTSTYCSALGRWFNNGQLLSLSLLLNGISAVGIALGNQWTQILAMFALAGGACGLADAILNHHTASNYPSKFLQWLHGSYGVGVTAGPLLVTAALAWQFTWQIAYGFIASCMFALAFVVWQKQTLWVESSGIITANVQPDSLPLYRSLLETRVVLGLLCFFFYCGVEVAIGLWAFSLFTDMRHMTIVQAGLWVSIYWGTFTAGRFLAGWYIHRLTLHSLITLVCSTALSGCVLLGADISTTANGLAIAAIGLAFAPVYPGLMAQTEQRVGSSHKKNAIGLQVAAGGLGAVAVPSAVGAITATWSLEAMIPTFASGVILLWLIHSYVSKLASNSPAESTFQ